MTDIAYPSSLPAPSAAPLQWAERRQLSSLPGPRGSRILWTDRLGSQSLEFILRSAAQVQTWVDWVRDDLQDGAAWFSASWPQPQGGVGARRFIGAPSYPEYLPVIGAWRISALCEVRGRGELPVDPSDPYFDDVILFMNGDDSGDVVRDFSPRHATYANSGITRNSTDQKYGSGCLDASSGYVTVEPVATYAALLGANEWTLRLWFNLLALPPQVDGWILECAAMGVSCHADGHIDSGALLGLSSYNVTSPTGLLMVERWDHLALTRTNDGANSHLELFHQGEYIASSPTFSAGATMNNAGGFDIVGFFGGSDVLLDDLQLTRNINRYRGLTSFDPPGKLPIR